MTHDNGPRLIGRKEAAAYLGIGESTFSLWVSTHKMPQPIPGTRKWDKRAIDAKLDAISGLDKPAVDDMDEAFAKWEREQNAVQAELAQWRRDRDSRKSQRAGETKKPSRKR